MRNDTIDSFLAALADRVPAPGGGASAGLHAAQAAALLAMVARYSDGNRFAEHAELVQKVCDTADRLREEALGLAEDDVAAFGAVTEAYRLAKGDDGEAATRDALAVLAALEDRREEST
jgi:formiminotetrahydrofolate cyclodeaminase